MNPTYMPCEPVPDRYLAMYGDTQTGDRPTSQLYLRVPYGGPALGRRGVRTYRYTLSIEKTKDGIQEVILHDNVEDPFQLENIADRRPDIVGRLTETELEPWLEKTGDPWLGS